jgi:cell division protein FtsL
MLQTSRVRQLPPPDLLLGRPTVRRRIGPPQARTTAPSKLRLGPVVVSVCLCVFGLVLYMWPRVHSVRLGYQLQRSEQRLRDLLQERDQLRLDIASLKDPRRVYEVATEQLGMQLPRREQVFFLTREGKVQ